MASVNTCQLLPSHQISPWCGARGRYPGSPRSHAFARRRSCSRAAACLRRTCHGTRSAPDPANQTSAANTPRSRCRNERRHDPGISPDRYVAGCSRAQRQSRSGSSDSPAGPRRVRRPGPTAMAGSARLQSMSRSAPAASYATRRAGMSMLAHLVRDLSGQRIFAPATHVNPCTWSAVGDPSRRASLGPDQRLGRANSKVGGAERLDDQRGNLQVNHAELEYC
jgi:hypothetical protein